MKHISNNGVVKIQENKKMGILIRLTQGEILTHHPQNNWWLFVSIKIKETVCTWWILSMTNHYIFSICDFYERQNK